MISQHFWTVETPHNRAEYEYIHNGKSGISTAFEIKEKAEIYIKIPRLIGCSTVLLDVFDETTSRKLCEIEGEWCGLSGEFDRYIFQIPISQLGTGLYFMRPRLSVFGGSLYGHKWADAIYFDGDSRLSGLMQFSLCNFAYQEPKKILGGVIYHIFVDRFRRGGPSETPDGARVIYGEWKKIPEYPEYPGAPLKNNTFYGGTLWGIIEKLDYISSLGVSAIYLSPIFKAASNHKYDTADYMTVDPIFGGEKALEALIKACKEKNIELILDGVFNHTGSDSIYFNRYGRYKELGAFQSKKSKFYDWYTFEEYPRKYTCWWGIDILPRINPDNPSCGNYFVGEGGVIDKYSKMGIYGFRLDVADELSDDFISKIKSRLSKNNKDNILYGEVWEDASNKISYGNRRKYYLGRELDGVMNYPLRSGIIDFLCGRGKEKLAYALTDVTANTPVHILHNQMNLLGTHDTERILTVLGGEDREGKSNKELSTLKMNNGRRSYAVNKLMSAYTVLATVPGIPTIFYGDEAGLEGYGDPFNRMPYPWGKEDQRLLRHYKAIGEIRKSNEVYKEGGFKLLCLDENLLIFSRTDGKYAFITVVNNSDSELHLSFEDTAESLIRKKWSKAFDLKSFCADIYKIKVDSYIEIT